MACSASLRVRVVCASSSVTRARAAAASASASCTLAWPSRSACRCRSGSSRTRGCPFSTASPLSTSTSASTAVISGRMSTWLWRPHHAADPVDQRQAPGRAGSASTRWQRAPGCRGTVAAAAPPARRGRGHEDENTESAEKRREFAVVLHGGPDARQGPPGPAQPTSNARDAQPAPAIRAKFYPFETHPVPQRALAVRRARGWRRPGPGGMMRPLAAMGFIRRSRRLVLPPRLNGIALNGLRPKETAYVTEPTE